MGQSSLYCVGRFFFPDFFFRLGIYNLSFRNKLSFLYSSGKVFFLTVVCLIFLLLSKDYIHFSDVELHPLLSCILPKEWFPLGLNYVHHILSNLIISISSFRFRVSPVSPEVPGIRASAQRHGSEPGWSRADDAQRPAVNGQGGGRGHGDHRDRDPLPYCQIPALFGASAHIARPQTRSD